MNETNELLLTESLWVEKYRPRSLNEMVLSEDYRKKFSEYIRNKEIPHLLLYGGAGGGKSTIARILVDGLCGHENDFLEVAGSTDTGVDYMRDVVESFASLPTINSKFKIIFIDEFDLVSNNAQGSLRGTLEKYYENARFIFTLNYYHKVIDGVKSRCQNYEFKQLPKEYIKTHVENILTSESVKYDTKIIDRIIKMYYPDVRRIVGTISKHTVDGEITHFEPENSPENGIKSNITEIFLYFKGIGGDPGNCIQRITEIASNNEVDYASLYNDVFLNENTPVWAKILISKYSNNHTTAIIPSLNFIACVYDIIEVGQKLLGLVQRV